MSSEARRPAEGSAASDLKPSGLWLDSASYLFLTLISIDNSKVRKRIGGEFYFNLN
jgi:hypothetical protein